MSDHCCGAGSRIFVVEAYSEHVLRVRAKLSSTLLTGSDRSVLREDIQRNIPAGFAWACARTEVGVDEVAALAVFDLPVVGGCLAGDRDITN
jgi:hypothetical protein